MSPAITLSIDAMGGDAGPSMVLPGLEIALERRRNTGVILYGERAVLDPLLENCPRLKERATLIDAVGNVRMDDRPSQALRKGRWKSSMWKALEAVKQGEADVCVSAGNTGALMAMSKFCLRTMANVERPAIAAIWPTLNGDSVVLDVGATVGADAHQLVDFAVMGGAMARALFENERPKVGLLNIGVEEVKGVEEVRAAGRLLRQAGFQTIDYHGFVEGDDLGKGTVDVVVTEGFAGNIALKTAEGTARQIATYLKSAMARSLLSRLGYIIAKTAFDRLRDKLDPRKINGGVFLGLNGVVIKSHGGTDAEGFASAVELGIDMSRNRLLEKIQDDLTFYHRASITQDISVSNEDSVSKEDIVSKQDRAGAEDKEDKRKKQDTASNGEPECCLEDLQQEAPQAS